MECSLIILGLNLSYLQLVVKTLNTWNFFLMLFIEIYFISHKITL